MMSCQATANQRLASARKHYGQCLLCEHRCGVDRNEGERGTCRAIAEARVFRHRVEYGEELELIPSHLFYLSGCDLRCAFCIAEENAFDPRRGEKLTPEFFSQAVAWGSEQKSRNIQWVGGEPTIHIPAILEAMAGCHQLPPVVWKSDFYGTPAAFDLLSGVVDVFVADFKFGNDACAKRISSVDDYVRIVTRNLSNGCGQADLIVRHLLLPGHFDCCYRAIVAWMSTHMPTVKFSIRDGYLPHWRARRFSDLAKQLERQAGENARKLANDFGLNVIS